MQLLQNLSNSIGRRIVEKGFSKHLIDSGSVSEDSEFKIAPIEYSAGFM